MWVDNEFGNTYHNHMSGIVGWIKNHKLLCVLVGVILFLLTKNLNIPTALRMIMWPVLL